MGATGARHGVPPQMRRRSETAATAKDGANMKTVRNSLLVSFCIAVVMVVTAVVSIHPPQVSADAYSSHRLPAFGYILDNPVLTIAGASITTNPTSITGRHHRARHLGVRRRVGNLHRVHRAGQNQLRRRQLADPGKRGGGDAFPPMPSTPGTSISRRPTTSGVTTTAVQQLDGGRVRPIE